MTAVAQALIIRTSKIEDMGSLASMVTLSGVSLLLSLCFLLYGFDLSPF